MKSINPKLMLVVSMLATMGCNSVDKNQTSSFDDYPVCEGTWEEMIYSPESTQFSLWAPTAQEVRLFIYDEGIGGSVEQMVSMTPAEDGLWNAEIEGDLNGKFYVFNVKTDDNWLGDTPGIKAKALGVNGDRAAIVDLKATDPEGWTEDVRPTLKDYSDIIIYEMHHRDFSIDSLSGIKNKGKFLALTEEGTTYLGEKTGIDHLKELGVTHVHILPSFDFSSVDETKLDQPQYNWGYDPKNYNAPDGSYATDPYNPEVRIKEFKQMVMALHKAGIRVIMDVVYNHTAVTQGSNFERTVPGYFYRQNSEGGFADASACGNETASERPMMRRFMTESVSYWAEEYHVDGFRFDLMGIHDMETMKAIRAALDKIDPTIFIYGEGWAAAAPQLPTEELAMKVNTHLMPRIAAFSDEYRDSIRGPFGHDEEGAFLVGKSGHEAGVKFGLVGGIKHPQIDNDTTQSVPQIWADQPTQFIAYASCHDDMCLADRIKVTIPSATPIERAALQKLAETAILTSQGVPFIFCGDELMRDKKGVGNSYCSPDDINAIDWRLKTEHRDVFDYVSGLISMRKAHPCFHLGDAELIRQHLEFLEVPEECVIAFRIKGSPLGDTWANTTVVLNANATPVKVELPEGKYYVIANDGRIDAENPMGMLFGGPTYVGGRTAMILHE